MVSASLFKSNFSISRAFSEVLTCFSVMLRKIPSVTAKPVKTSEKARDMLKFDLNNEAETIRNYRTRVRQCEELGEFAMAEQIREILVQEQDHLIDLATALGEDVPDLGEARGPKTRK